MINLHDLSLMYPITFRVDGGVITFTNNECGISDAGVASAYTARDFAETHNNINPENDEGKPFYIPRLVNGFVQRAAESHTCNDDVPLNQVIGRGFRMDNPYIESAIEDMPIGAQIVGIKRCEDEWDDLNMKVRRVEVHDDIIVLLAHHSMHGVGYGAEVNIKRGTIVRYTKG